MFEILYTLKSFLQSSRDFFSVKVVSEALDRRNTFSTVTLLNANVDFRMIFSFFLNGERVYFGNNSNVRMKELNTIVTVCLRKTG